MQIKIKKNLPEKVKASFHHTLKGFLTPRLSLQSFLNLISLLIIYFLFNQIQRYKIILNYTTLF